jgi:hypothetical protein
MHINMASAFSGLLSVGKLSSSTVVDSYFGWCELFQVKFLEDGLKVKCGFASVSREG